MKASTMPRVNPRILLWARETAGLSLDDAARKLGIQDARGVAAADRLALLEAGDVEPNRPLLVKMARHYRRPLVAFYLAEPPRAGNRGEDFRTIPDRDRSTEALIDALIRDVRARQSMVRSILELEEAPPLNFIGSLTLNAGLAAGLRNVREAIQLDLATYRAQNSPEAAFGLLRTHVESAGVFVLLMGNLGSHHTAIDVGAFRGFALADKIAPFIILNDQDAKPAWSFTLLHEVVHLFLGATGVSNAFAESQIERFCNDVASSFLLPAEELPAVGVTQNTTVADATQRINEFARDRHLSRSMVAYRLYRANLLNEVEWRTLFRSFREQWQQARDARRERDRQNEGGPTFYIVRRHRLGPALLRLVSRNISEGELTPTKAGKILGVRPRNVAPLLSGAVPFSGQAA